MTTFWKPGTVAPGSLLDRSDDAQTIVPAAVYESSLGHLTIQQQRARLPIYSIKNEILYLLEKNQVICLLGETGCGKTTQIPQYLQEYGWTNANSNKQQMIACTQPRRLAASAVAQRVAEEMGVRLGEEVGYSIRFEDCTSATTRIKYMTDGMLFREALMDPLLSRYSCIILDEAHEHTIYTDLMVGMMKKILKKRPELRLIITSATLDVEKFYKFFSDALCCSILSVSGRQFPVEVYYLEEPCSDYVQQSVDTVVQIHQSDSRPGDILVFLTGKDEIEKAISALRLQQERLNNSNTLKLLIFGLYAGQNAEDQRKALNKPQSNRVRKVIFSTNVAEASITIEGVAFVVDCGLVKMKTFDPLTGVDRLTVCPISKSAAQQRAGRAGRLRPGKVYRLYTEDSYTHLMTDFSVPEIQRSNLAPIILQLKALGIDNILRFPFLTTPPKEIMVHALDLLYSLQALDDNCKLTDPIGLQLAEMPVDPLMSAMLINSKRFNCTAEALTVAAMLSVDNLFVGGQAAVEKARRRFAVEEGDHVVYLNIYQLFEKNFENSQKWCLRHSLNLKALQRAMSIRVQLAKYLHKFDISATVSCGREIKQLQRCIVSAYFPHACHVRQIGRDGVGVEESSTYESLRGGLTDLCIHPSSVFFKTRLPEWVLYHEVVHSSKVFMRDLMVIEPEWLVELAPHYYQFKR